MGLRSKRSVDKLANGPSAIHNAQRLGWRRLDGFVNTAQIVMRDVQRDRCKVGPWLQGLLRLGGRCRRCN
jgi:hypothetical protein